MRLMPIPCFHSSRFRRLVRASCLAAAVTMSSMVAGAAADELGAPPPFIHQALPGATLWGQGHMRFFGLQIYDARLWAGPRFEAADFGAYPLALELTYHRAFTGAAIAQRSIEEIGRQGALPPAQAQRWLRALAAVLPDVQPGDRLTGLYQPGLGMRLWHNTQPRDAIDDPELTRRFFSIWLSPHTSEPSLRRALLAGPSGMGR